jgi:hypothetical protein
MKFKFLFLCLLLPLFIHAQVSYNRYLDSSSVWFEWSSGMYWSPNGCNMGGELVKFYRRHIVGWDSLDGQAWYLLHEDWTSEIICSFQPTQYGAWQAPMPPTSRIREDSTGKIWRKEGNAPAVMRYDFRPGLQVTDTLWMEDYTQHCAIALIDTVYLGSDTRQRYWCDCSQPGDSHYVIEGVGYFRGLDATIVSVCNPTIDFELRMICYHQGGDSIILDSQKPCGLPSHNPQVGVAEAALQGFSVYWQATDESIVLTQLPPGGKLEWTLFDPQGRLVRAGIHASTQIPLPDLSSGLYLFVGRNGSGQFVKRFVR